MGFFSGFQNLGLGFQKPGELRVLNFDYTYHIYQSDKKYDNMKMGMET